MKKVMIFFVFLFTFFLFTSRVKAGWVDGYYRSNGTYVNGYYKTDPDMYKWNNYSFDNDWSDSYNDNTYYKSYGYDPEPYDDDYVSSYPNDYYWDNSDDYNYGYNYDSDWSSWSFWDW